MNTPFFTWFNLSCHEATLLSVKKQGGVTLSSLERVRLWWHHKICAVCKIWEDQSAAIDMMLSRFWSVNEAEKNSQETMSQQRKTAIELEIERNTPE